MHRFQFPYDSLLKLKEQLEWETRLQKERALGAIRRKQREIDELNSQLDELTLRAVEKGQSRFVAGAALDYLAMSARTCQSIGWIQNEIERASRELSAIHEKHLRQMREIEVLRTLREERWAEHRREADRQAAEELNEFILRRGKVKC